MLPHGTDRTVQDDVMMPEQYTILFGQSISSNKQLDLLLRVQCASCVEINTQLTLMFPTSTSRSSDTVQNRLQTSQGLITKIVL